MKIPDGIASLFATFPRVVPPAAGLWFLGGLGLTVFLWYPPTRRNALLLLGWTVSSLLAFSLGMYFREHYYIFLLPALSLCLAILVTAGIARLEQYWPRTTIPAIPIGIFLLALFWAVWDQRSMFFEVTPVEFARNLYAFNPFPEALPIADFVRQHSQPKDRIAVLGSEPEIYFYARRHSATGYVYTYALMEPQPFARTMQDEMIAEIEAADPPVVVGVNILPSWTAYPDSDPHILRWTNKWVNEHYELKGVADIQGPGHTEFVWGDAASNYQAKSPYFVYTFVRKASQAANQASANPPASSRKLPPK